MEDMWQVRCSEGTTEKWTEKVFLCAEDVRVLLQMLLCRNLDSHEIIATVERRRELLEVRESKGTLYTVEGLLQYEAKKLTHSQGSAK